MQYAMAMTNQIALMGVIVAIGFACGKARYLPDSSSSIIAQIIVKVTLPALIISTMMSYEFTGHMLISGLLIMVCAAVLIACEYFVGSLADSMLKLPPPTGNVYRMLFMLSNIGFLGVPLIQSIYGDNGLVYALFYMIVNDTALWTIGVYFAGRHKKDGFKMSAEYVKNPNIIAFTLGVLLVVTNVRGYMEDRLFLSDVLQFIYGVLNPLGKMTVYLSMIFIGLILSEIKFSGPSDILKRYPLFILAFVKLLLLPAAALLAFNITGVIVDPFIKKVVVLLFAMPSGSVVPVLLAQSGSDYRFAAEGVFITTIMSAFTLPVMVLLVSM